MLIRDVLEKSEEAGGVTKAPPLTQENYEKLEKGMKELNLSLPNDYVEFLEITDGLFWGGLEFFGTAVFKDKGIYITDLLTQNKLYHDMNAQTGIVFLGRNDEENFIFDIPQKKYFIVDEFSRDVIKDFFLFEEMFEYLMLEQSELVQNIVGFHIPENDTDADEEKEEDDDINPLVGAKFFK